MEYNNLRNHDDKSRLVIFTGAGVSEESGLPTFRDSDGLWEGYSICEVATPEAWLKNPKLVLSFYNDRRKALQKASPNAAHIIIAELEEYFDVCVITQNVDDLHERAGSTNVIHLHGELSKARSSANPRLIYELEGQEIKIGDLCKQGFQLRPHIVWFGEDVPEMSKATKIAERADIFVVIGSSLSVYPAANLIFSPKQDIPRYMINPNKPDIDDRIDIHWIEKKASKGMEELKSILQKH